MTDKLYSVDVKVYATVYVRGETKAQARQRLKAFLQENECLEVAQGGVVTGRPFDAELPDASMSPAMTLVGPEPGSDLALV